jgi:hypothetical protein
MRRPTCSPSATPATAPLGEGVPVAHDRGPSGLDTPPLGPVAMGMAARPGDKAKGLVRRHSICAVDRLANVPTSVVAG